MVILATLSYLFYSMTATEIPKLIAREYHEGICDFHFKEKKIFGLKIYISFVVFWSFCPLTIVFIVFWLCFPLLIFQVPEVGGVRECRGTT